MTTDDIVHTSYLDNRFDLMKLKDKDSVVMDSDWKRNSFSFDTVVIGYHKL